MRTSAVLSIAYSSAWRTLRLFIAPFALGLCRFITRYGLLLYAGKTPRFGSFAATRAGRFAVGTTSSHDMSVVPACSCCWMVASLEPCVISIRSTYALRIGSVLGSQPGLRSSVMDFLSSYLVLW